MVAFIVAMLEHDLDVIIYMKKTRQEAMMMKEEYGRSEYTLLRMLLV